ncbi:hypothetical protein H206_02630 [Candidatus Electrothrix aarhusensis]|jgi:hypothetical protein|uniref:Uncharacterized protein n=1 Tax=Candidatus Electrothrix aarhusensis TaxID=1859131 RepID=A0A3S3QVK3_9BACT|nr:hypothetical protein H206_02630 [Candidatus Electrothrix aarhusensis]
MALLKREEGADSDAKKHQTLSVEFNQLNDFKLYLPTEELRTKIEREKLHLRFQMEHPEKEQKNKGIH